MNAELGDSTHVPQIESRASRKSLASTIWRDRTVLLPATLLVLFVGGSLFAPLLTAHDPAMQSLRDATVPPLPLGGADPWYLLGTDHLGRDLLSRLLFGGRISLLVAFIAVVLSGTLGVVAGLLAGYYGGLLEAIIMRVVDIQLSFPAILLAIAIMAVAGPGLEKIILVLAVTGWVIYTRIVHGQVLQLREAEYVEGARAIGASDWRILTRYILPNVFSSIIIVATLAVPQMIIWEASLSFLGLGVQPPTPTWGSMLADSRNYLTTAWWTAVLPGLAITIVVLSLNLLGDWLRDYLDPTLNV